MLRENEYQWGNVQTLALVRKHYIANNEETMKEKSVQNVVTTYVTCSNKTRNKSHGTILRYRSLKLQVQKYCQNVKFEVMVFL